MFTQIELITPEIAAQYLKKNGANRTLTERHVARLEKAMRDGEWTLNGEAIKFDRNGRLIDGQHRMQAVIRSGECVRMLVVYDVPEGSFDTLDTGRTRSGGDVLSIIGHINTNVLASAARIVLAWEQGDIYRAMLGVPYSHRAIKECVTRHPNLCAFATKGATSSVYSMAMRVGISYLAIHTGAEKSVIDEFWDRLCDGIGLQSDSPIWQLRERMIQARNRTGMKLDRQTQLALGIKCLKAHIIGAPMRVLRISRNEDLPTF